MEEQDIEQIRLSRQKRFQQMGVMPTFTPEEVEQVSAASSMGAGKNGGVRDRINAIKNGRMKETMTELNNAKNPYAFESVPVNNTAKPNRNNSKNGAPMTEKKEFSAPPKVARNSEADSYEAMFDTDSPRIRSNDVVMGNLDPRKQNQPTSNQPLISEESLMGSAPSWEDQFKNKLSTTQQQAPVAPPQTQNQSYLSYAQTPSSLHEVSVNNAGMPMAGNAVPIHLVEKIANDIVDKRIKDLITEVMSKNNASKNTNELTYKKVRGKSGDILDGVISIEGKFYKLEEIKNNPNKK